MVFKRRSPLVMKLFVIILYVLPVFVLISNFNGSVLSASFTMGTDSCSSMLSISSNWEGTHGFIFNSDSNITLILGTGSVAVHIHAISHETCCCAETIAHPCIMTLSCRIVDGCWESKSKGLAGILGVEAERDRLGGGDRGVMLRLRLNVGDPCGETRMVTSLLFLDRVARYVFDVMVAVMVSVSPSSMLLYL